MALKDVATGSRLLQPEIRVFIASLLLSLGKAQVIFWGVSLSDIPDFS